MLALLLSAIAGWLIGSIPTAHLVVKARHGLEIHREGSTNVGANNAFRASGSKRTGALVLVGDALKGVLAVNVGWLVAVWAAAPAFGPASAALLGAIAGHNYNLFLSRSAGRLVGGKGLATALGGFLLILPGMVAVWAAGFAVGLFGFEAWRGVRDAVPGNVVGTAIVPFVGWGLYGPAAGLVLLLFALLVLPKHTTQVRALLQGSGIRRK